MRPVRECLELTDAEIDAEISMRIDLRREMVGTLYPGILLSEIYTLQDIKNRPLLDRLALLTVEGYQ